MVLPLSVISGVWIGHQMMQLMASVSGSAALASGMEIWAEVFFLVYTLCILLYAWGTWHSNEIGKESIKMQVKGDLLKISLIGVGGFAILLPFILTLIMWGANTNGFLIFLRLASIIAGDLALRYVIMKSAVYKPLI